MPLHMHLGREYDFLLGIVHLVVGPPLRNRRCTGRRRSDEDVIMKEVDVWP